MIDVVGLTVVAAFAAVTGWLAVRTWRRGRPLLRRLRATLAGLLCFLTSAVLVLALTGYRKLTRRHDNPVPDIQVVVTPELVARGEPLVAMCAGCHSADGAPPLEGLDPQSVGGAPPIGRFFAPNLTPIHLGDWTDGEIIRAIRQGIHRSGRSLIIMPSATFASMSDEDAAAIVAFLRAQPPVEPDTPPTRLNILGAVGASFAPILSAQPPPSERQAATDAQPLPPALGSTLCVTCHGPDLAGNPDLASADLRGVGASWTEQDFLSFFETGVKPDGEAVDAARMPWSVLAQLYDEEQLRAIYSGLGELRGSRSVQ